MWSRGNISRSYSPTSRVDEYLLSIAAQVLPDGPPPITATSWDLIDATLSEAWETHQFNILRVGRIELPTSARRWGGHTHSLRLCDIGKALSGGIAHLPGMGDAGWDIRRAGSTADDSERDNREYYSSK